MNTLTEKDLARAVQRNECASGAIRKFTVCRDDRIYEAWPDLALIDDRRMVCVFTECDHHGDRTYSRVMSVFSDDRGRTWSAKRPITPPRRKLTPDDQHWNCARVTALDDGSLVVVVDEVGGADEGNSPGAIQRNWLFISRDGGETWEEPRATPVTGIVPDRLLVLRAGDHPGRWLLGAHRFVTDEAGVQTWTQSMWYSDDQGGSWSGPVVVAQSSEYKLCEGCLLELSDGSLVCFMRENSLTGLDCFKVVSRDGGLTWSGLQRTPIAGCHRPVAGHLNSGRVMITYRLMPGGKTGWGLWTQNLCAVLTDESGCLATERSQMGVRLLPIDYDRSPQADTGYSGWVQFADGEIYIVNYIMDDAPKAYIRGYSLDESAFILPIELDKAPTLPGHED